MTTGEVIEVSIVNKGLYVVYDGKEGIRNFGESIQNTVKMYYNNLYMKSGQLIEDGSNRGRKLLGISKSEK